MICNHTIYNCQGFDINWCKQPDVGLPQPDRVIYLTLSPEEAAKRGNFGDERYEQTEFQQKVSENFEKLRDSIWTVSLSFFIPRDINMV